jgi:hypothetical protein
MPRRNSQYEPPSAGSVKSLGRIWNLKNTFPDSGMM